MECQEEVYMKYCRSTQRMDLNFITVEHAHFVLPSLKHNSFFFTVSPRINGDSDDSSTSRGSDVGTMGIVGGWRVLPVQSPVKHRSPVSDV